MKTIFTVSALLILSACTINSVDDDDLFTGSVFETEGDFNAGNNYTLFYEFPGSFVVLESDIVLVYILWEQSENGGKLTDVWRLLPQTVVLEGGILQYNFDYTRDDVQIFLDGDIAFNTLLPAETQDQVFRIVVLPAEYAINKNLETIDFNLLMKDLGVDSGSFKSREFRISGSPAH